MLRSGPGRVLFVGDEVSALGFRLAGLETVVADAHQVPDVDASVSVVVTTRALAPLVARRARGAALLPIATPEGGSVDDLAERVRRELGIGK